jgi:hypothetical protein
MGLRRIFAALAVLALGLLLATAGVAAASSQFSSDGSVREHDWSTDSNPKPPVTEPPVTQPPVTQAPAPEHPSHGGNPDQEPSSGGGVTAEGTPPAGVPQTPVTAPAAAVNGPAPATAAAAPIDSGAAVAPETGTGPDAGNGGTPTAATADPPAVAPQDPYSLAGIPQLRSLGQIAAAVTDGPAAARQLLTTPTGRSVLVLLGLVLAIVVFLSLHRRLDRGDPKLAAAQLGSDVERFR